MGNDDTKRKLPFQVGQPIEKQGLVQSGNVSTPSTDEESEPSTQTETDEPTSAESLSQQIGNSPEPEQAENDEESGDEEEPEAPAPLEWCPRCSLHLSEKYEVTATAKDKQDFTRSILTGSQFTKCYDRFNGRLRIWFRDKTAEEMDLMSKQLRRDRAEYDTGPVLLRRSFQLGMALCLQKVEVIDENGGVVKATEYPSASEVGNAPDGYATVVGYMYDQLLKSGMAEMVFNAVSAAYHDFHRLCDLLAHRSVDPNFWTATAPAT